MIHGTYQNNYALPLQCDGQGRLVTAPSEETTQTLGNIFTQLGDVGDDVEESKQLLSRISDSCDLLLEQQHPLIEARQDGRLFRTCGDLLAPMNGNDGTAYAFLNTSESQSVFATRLTASVAVRDGTGNDNRVPVTLVHFASADIDTEADTTHVRCLANGSTVTPTAAIYKWSVINSISNTTLLAYDIVNDLSPGSNGKVSFELDYPHGFEIGPGQGIALTWEGNDPTKHALLFSMQADYCQTDLF